MQQPFDGILALITGAASGIGAATARLFASKGAHVFAGDIDLEGVNQLATEEREKGNLCTAIQMDVSSQRDWTQFCEQASASDSKWQVLVNAAGISITKPLATISYEEWSCVMQVNLDGAFFGIQAALQNMHSGGSITNVASVSGAKPFGGAAAYCTSKAALRMLTKTAAIECADATNGIRVNLVTPGGVKTPMWQKEAFFQDLINEHGSPDKAYEALSGNRPSAAFCEADDVAEAIVMLSNTQNSTMNGIEVVLDQGNTL